MKYIQGVALLVFGIALWALNTVGLLILWGWANPPTQWNPGFIEMASAVALVSYLMYTPDYEVRDRIDIVTSLVAHTFALWFAIGLIAVIR